MDDFIQRPTEAQGYRAAAQAMLEGARPLSKVNPVPNIALTLLCGHGTEAALKALLAESGLTAEVLSKRPYSHEIINLWEAAAKSGIALPEPRPLWVAQLDRVHTAPYKLRYPLGFHMLVLPDQEGMLDGLHLLVKIVNETVK